MLNFIDNNKFNLENIYIDWYMNCFIFITSINFLLKLVFSF